MMNKKGFTVIELMTTFILVAIISTLLIKLVVTLKEIYISGDMKTALITKQSTMTDKIYKDLDKNNLTKIEKCDTINCVNFVYTDGTKKFTIDKDKKTITYDNYTIKLGKEGKLGEASIEVYATDIGYILSFKVPIYNRLLKGDYGINISYQLDDEIEFDDDIEFDVSDMGTKVEFDENMNLIYGLYNIGETNAEYMKYSINNEIVTVTSNRADGYGITTGRADLEAGKTYVFSCNTDAPEFKYSESNDTVQAYFLLDGEYTTFYGMVHNNFEFTPESSGTYWLRLDVDKINTTHKFWDISVKEKKTNKTKQVTQNENYGKLPSPKKNGYTFVGWSAIPSEYQQVAYIESTGTQYIDSDYIASSKTGIEVDFQFTDLTTQQRIFGVTTDDSNYLNYNFYINGSTKWGYAFVDGAGNWMNTDVDANKNKHKLQFNVENNKYKIDNFKGSIADSTRNKKSTGLYIFTYNTSSSSKLKIYSFKIYEDSKLVRNYVPVYRKSDSEIGLYETIEGKFYTNKGTGKFNKGVNGGINDISLVDSGTKVTRNNSHTLTGVWAKEYNITNLVKNGSFENGLNNWEKYNYLDPSATIHTSNTLYKKFGNKSIERLSNDTNSKNLIAQSIHFIEGHKYYYFLSGYTNSTTSQRISSDVNSRSNSNITFDITKQVGWVKGSVIYTSEATEDRNISINCAVTTDKTYVDGVGVIDLTDAFGAGNEPTKEWCDENIDYFNGTKTIVKKHR